MRQAAAEEVANRFGKNATSCQLPSLKPGRRARSDDSASRTLVQRRLASFGERDAGDRGAKAAPGELVEQRPGTGRARCRGPRTSSAT